MDGEQAVVVFQLIEWRSAAYDRYFFHAIRHRPSTGIGVRGAARNCEDAKTIDRQKIGDFIEERRPIIQPPVRLEFGVADAGRSGEIIRAPSSAEASWASSAIVRELGQP
jgi:hypothetical protein